MTLRTRTTLSLVAGSALFLTACTDPGVVSDPNRDINQTRNGALIGGAIGAVTGILRGDDPEERRRGAVIGAAIGAGAGAIIGNQLDKQEADLRSQLGNNVGIQNTGDRLIVTLPQDILFATDSAVVRPDLQRDIRSVAASLQAYPNTTVQIVGHTDNTGDPGYNQGLSERRAQSVAGILISEGVTSGRIQSIGRGDSQPVATNLTAEGRQQNRRVEIVILPNA